MTGTPSSSPSPSSAALIHEIILAATLSPSFAVLFVALRFYTAKFIIRVIHKDDWMILIGVIFSIGYSITLGILTQYGLGTHIWEIPPTDTFRMYMLLNAFPATITGHFAHLFTKSSILVFYLRFSVSRAFNYAAYFMLLLVIAHNLTGATTILYSCRPISTFWTFAPGGTCIDANPWYGTIVALNIFTDVILLLLPFWLLKPLNIVFVQKAAIALVLGTGGFVLGVSIMRLVIAIKGFSDDDATYRFGVNYMWSIIEINVAIICACLPCLRAFLVHMFPWLAMLTPVRSGSVSLHIMPISQLVRETRQEQAIEDNNPRPTTQAESNHNPRILDVDHGVNIPLPAGDKRG
ncbi:hypothetical protein B0H66DRAFT_540312 [Apodospora peruviana]|uniref:Rhodopsin domain-containing protein n=1 Tax=Apodospora peruviana TaxID=516989 RepID=A0AAE0ME20_9PEZI|nr:hypothetical protein B0H66DRAFT_540312 [Apodospora peruviana]